MSNRIPWDQYFMSQSLVLSLRSTCTRLAVGATIVRDKRIISGGYNGSASGDDHCDEKGCYVEEGHCMRTIHAEANAVLQCAKFGAQTQGAEIYVTHFPCLQCTKMIVQAGITKIYYLHDYRNHPYALKLLDQNQIECIKVDIPEDFFKTLSIVSQNNKANMQKNDVSLLRE